MIDTTIIGVGSANGDDCLGLHVADILKQQTNHMENVRITTCDHTVFDWIEEVRPVNRVLFIDAIRSSAEAGTVHCIRVTTGEIPNGYHNVSSHGLALPDAIRIGQTLALLPQQVDIFGIEMEHSHPGLFMSPKVIKSIPQLITKIEYYLESRV